MPLQRCLIKEPKRPWQVMGDVRMDNVDKTYYVNFAAVVGRLWSDGKRALR